MIRENIERVLERVIDIAYMNAGSDCRFFVSNVLQGLRADSLITESEFSRLQMHFDKKLAITGVLLK